MKGLRTLIILAHPEPKSYNGHLAQEASRLLQSEGGHAAVLDLYAENFDPREGGVHYENRVNPETFDAQKEQRHHWDNATLPGDVSRHIRLLMQSDVVIFQFPFWWFGAPAILKGWMDRVFVYGIYDSHKRYDQGAMRGKKALLSVTTGSSATSCSYNGREGDTRLLLWPILYSLHYLGFDVLEPSIIHGVRGNLVDDRALRDEERRYLTRLAELQDWPSFPFNSSEDFENGATLKACAPSHSPFIRKLPTG